LRLRRTVAAIEINGRAREDNESRGAGSLVRNLSNLSELLLLRRANITFNVTEELRKGSEAVNPNAAHIHVDNGVARTFFAVRSEHSKPIRFIYVGTFTPWDGADRIIELAKDRPDLEFVMVGDGSRRSRLQEGAPPNVEFRGWRDYGDLPREYARCSAGIVLYTAARHRSIGMSSLKTREYVAAGLPVFSTKVQGQEFIESRGFGLLSDEQLKEDLQRFLDRYPEYRANLKAARPQLVAEFSWSAAAAKTIEALKRAQERSRAKRL
jgi:glycosyltransferase involved in cell wall biosynthesis